MLTHPLLPDSSRPIAFWTLARLETGYHVALRDLASGHTLWSHTGTRPLDALVLPDILDRFRGYGWDVEPFPTEED